MTAKKKPARKPAKKKIVKKKSRVSSVPGNGLKKYATFLRNEPAVKRKTEKIKKLESQLKMEKKLKATAKKAAAKKWAKRK